MRRKNFFFKLFSLIFFVIFLCEYLIYYIVILQCSWPAMRDEQADISIEIEQEDNAKAVKAMFIADVHLLGSTKGRWFDGLRREWQMFRAFQTAVNLFNPEIIFILGDLFDEGLRSNDNEFQYYVKRLNSIFRVPYDVKIYLVAGNHDVGYHYDITPNSHDRFTSTLKSPPVQLISVKGNHFVLINSMAMEGDGCFLCRLAQVEINKIARVLAKESLKSMAGCEMNKKSPGTGKLRCAKGIGKCPLATSIKQYSRPILLQHFPMYRNSDRQCSELDQAPEDVKKLEFRERWDCLSREASEMIYDNLKPRVIVGGHSHHGCHVIHRKDIHEYTLPSFNWRKKNNPSFLLGIFLPNNYAVHKCHIPQESTVIFLYCLGFFFIVLWILLLLRPRNNTLYKLHRKYD